MIIPPGWKKHSDFSDDQHPVIVPDRTYFGARADPPPAPPGWVWLYYVPCDGYRLEREGAMPVYQPDDFLHADKGAIWKAVTEVARSK